MLKLSEFLVQQERQHAVADNVLTLIQDIAATCQAVAREIRYGALRGNMGSAGRENVQGEEQKALDVISNDIFTAMASKQPHVAAVASEEMAQAQVFAGKQGKYLLVFDPLDGSSNVNLNLSVGSIFSILPAPEGSVDEASFLQAGSRQLAAGYALYGTSTMLVLTMGHGVHGFTLDPDQGEFYLTHPGLTIAASTEEFAINMSNQRFWQPPVQRYIAECIAGSSGPRGKDFNMRWVATMVAEVHRLLVRGGVFLYPLDSRAVGRGGRLRLLYEANPMSLLVEQAGGLATTGHRRILDVEPAGLHQRVAVMMGAREEVERLQDYHSFTDPTA
ncbi:MULTISPECIES: class 1 fructose-bisphosphatase [Methylobacillus]|uniref:Fructose-1,6-bisphosphatase class 1 n=1 Tax=Methylobacillus flagellatus (strain ATCC 51484 / DSM 6875 / VKM B-1610 / KT) TaxID=265072 RepID=F16PA_METFK|nr:MULTISPECIES: class 1 fructose-bisphosphatase [Methylobacillus]Q1H3T1.1 RecName: Full=Fructose-1,6-bisphosphatase class 1; Short=FBPase class 1; AltName: Full=D-fructose-1,6-bisphosphate 1-phosphohydrolase class 1 [Methylobacillus flagellatus KT]ABE48856.1 D-fructose 1,6-bisphosphatase [Methylobacillus flagellatus KT]MPS49489.1 class 1 fructose-bisphosphatase [Methylobacillus sp.]